MQFETGYSLSTYEIVAPLGKGGMGEVYRARDTKLGREVAIKVLPEEVAADPERLTRFEREAKLLAALAHSNVATLHTLEQDGDTSFLVMELVEGEDLAQRLVRGPLPVDDAIALFTQIAVGLEAAHDKGILHRDLKPANLMLLPDGGVKILDFGLARAIQPEVDADSAGQTHSPTLTLAATRRGEILGTAAYMSPEQASGKELDPRTDVWAFGVCLYEALTGSRAFAGADVPNTLAAVLRDEADLEALPTETPPSVRRLLRRCLAKDRKQRLRAAGDARLELTEALESPASDEESPAKSKTFGRGASLAGVAAIALAAALLGWCARTPTPPAFDPQPMRRLSIQLPPERPVAIAGGPLRAYVGLSPDGGTLVYRTRSQEGSILVQHSLATEETRLIPGAEAGTSFFFSPDGRSIGFVAGLDPSVNRTTLWTMSLDRGNPLPLTELSGLARIFGRAAVWGDDGFVYYPSEEGLRRIPASGGSPELVLAKSAADIAQTPTAVLPGSKAVLLSSFSGFRLDQHRIEVWRQGTDRAETLVEAAWLARYSSTGHIVYATEESLVAQRFDPEELTLSGTPVAIAGPEAVGPLLYGPAHSIGGDGLLVYVPGRPRRYRAPISRLVWIDRNGDIEPLAAPAAPYTFPRLSPDGSKVLVSVEGQGLLVFDLVRGTTSVVESRETSRGLWTPDSKRIIASFGMVGAAAGEARLVWRLADGTGAATPLVSPGNLVFGPQAMTPDGSTLLMGQFSLDGSVAEGLSSLPLPLDGTQPQEGSPSPAASPRLLLEEGSKAALSWDGRWLAYSSMETGIFQVYVRPWPDLEARKWQISTDSGTDPVWSEATGELLFLEALGPTTPTGTLMAVSVETEGEELRAGIPYQVLDRPFQAGVARRYDISLDGQRFLTTLAEEGQGSDPDPTVISVVENWASEIPDSR